MSLKKERSKSFTLIEILVVIVVIGILSAFILIGTSSIISSANITKGKAFSDSLRNSLLMNLFSEWKLDLGTTGNTVLASEVLDSWSDKNANSIVSDPIVREGSDCFDGKCLEFDANDYVHFSSYNVSFDEISIEFWMKDLGSVNLWYDYLELYIDGSTRISFELSSVSPKRILAVNRINGVNYDSSNMDIGSGFNHYAGVFSKSGNYRRSYNNGKLAQPIVGWPGGYTSSDIRIGNTASNVFIMDTVRIYNSALSTSQIENNYYIGLNKLFKNKNICLKEFKIKIGELRNNLAKE